MAGCRGNDKHQEILNDLKLIDWGKFWLLVDDFVMMKVLGSGNNSADRFGNLFPDFMVADKHGNFIVGEIGRVNPDKWPANVPVVHIGFNGRVRLITSSIETNQKFINRVVSRIEEMVGYNTDNDKTKTAIGVLRLKSESNQFNAIVDMLKDGMTTTDIAKAGRIDAVTNSHRGLPIKTREAVKYIFKRELGDLI